MYLKKLSWPSSNSTGRFCNTLSCSIKRSIKLYFIWSLCNRLFSHLVQSCLLSTSHVFCMYSWKWSDDISGQRHDKNISSDVLNVYSNHNYQKPDSYLLQQLNNNHVLYFKTTNFIIFKIKHTIKKRSCKVEIEW